MIEYRDAIRDALDEELAHDDRVVFFGEDVAKPGGVFAVTGGLLERHGPDRVFDTPISELAISGAAFGAAVNGLRPVIEIMFGDFLPIAMDAIVNQASKYWYLSNEQASIPLVVRSAVGAGARLGACHSQTPTGWFLGEPGLKLAAPSTAADAKGLTMAAIRDDNPVIVFEHRLLYPVKEEVPEKLEPIPFGKARAHREGEDVTVIATGPMVHRSLEAAEEAERNGISVEVIDPRSLQPLDEDAIVESVKKTNRAVVTHEAITRMGFGAEVASVIQYQAFDWLDAPIERVGAKFAPLAFAPVMEEYVVPHAADVLAAIKRTVARDGA